MQNLGEVRDEKKYKNKIGEARNLKDHLCGGGKRKEQEERRKRRT